MNNENEPDHFARDLAITVGLFIFAALAYHGAPLFFVNLFTPG